MRLGAKAYAALPVEPVGGAADIRRRLEGATVINADLADRIIVSRLLSTVAEFFDHWLGGSFDAYCDWRESKGSRLRTRQDMMDRANIAAGFRVCLNKELPEGSSSKELLRQLALANPITPNSRSDQTAAMACTDDGVVIAYGRATQATPDPVDVKTSIPEELWYGQRELIGRNWWVPRITREELLRRHKRVLYAEIGIVIVSDRGRRLPVMTAWVLDPIRSEWELVVLTITNFGPSFGATCLEY